MRIARILGTVTLSRPHDALRGASLKWAAPLSLAALQGDEPPHADPIVVYDELGANIGSLIALSEGPEASQPFRPEIKPVDAYNAAILDHIDLN